MKKYLNGFSVIFALIVSYHFIINLISTNPIDFSEVVLVSLLLNTILTILHFSILIGKGYKIGEKPETILTAEKVQTILNDLNKKNWRKVEDSETRISFRTKMNSLYSFGEKVIFEKVNSENYRVYSKSTFPLTIFDYGKNLDNIKNLT